MNSFYANHKKLIDTAIVAATKRDFWSPFSEIPSRAHYGENAAQEGVDSFNTHLGKQFQIGPHSGDWCGEENALYGKPLAITYPKLILSELFSTSQKASSAWAKLPWQDRIGILTEALVRLNTRSFEMAHAVMHTTGQAFAMAFQAGGPHAQDRGLEALAYAATEMAKIPSEAYWEKPQGKRLPLKVIKKFHIRPKGIALIIGCNTFPTWNSYPGLFAALATGNTAIVKPHPKSILPLAITVKVIQDVITEAGLDPNIVSLAADTLEAPITEKLVSHPAIGTIDFTGSSSYGNRIEQERQRGVSVYTEKSGVNNIIIESTDDLAGMMNNLALSMSLYSGQMCTTPQNIFIPETGIETNEGHISFKQTTEHLTTAISTLLSDNKKAAGVLGALINPDVHARTEQANNDPNCILMSKEIISDEAPKEAIFTPAVLVLKAEDKQQYSHEQFGPVFHIIQTASSDEALSIVKELVQEKGALTLGAYTTSSPYKSKLQDLAINSGVSLSINLTQSLMVNQAAAFSDYHGTGANPAANASLTDASFIAGRYNIVEIRHHAD